MNPSCRRGALQAATLLAVAALAAACNPTSSQRPDASPDGSPPPVDGGMGEMPDAPVDARPDAPGPAKAVQFDVVYVNETTASFNFTGLRGFIVIINRGTMPFALNKVEIKSVTDNNDAVEWKFELRAGPEDPNQMLAPGHAAGLMSERAAELFYGGGLLDVDQVFDDEFMSFEWSFDVFAPIGVDIQSVVKLAVGDAEIELPFTIHVSQNEIRNHRAARLSSR
jgi:hypothetical protein